MPVTAVKTAWSSGGLVFSDKDGNEIFHVDGTNRKLVLPAGSLLDVAAITTAIVDKGGARFDVKAYGATGNGTTDDTTAFLLAKAAWLAAGGGTIYAGPGTYLLSRQASATGDSITNPYCLLFSATDPGGVLLGAGNGATKFKLAAGATANTALILARGSSVTKRTAPLLIQGIEFDGNGAAQSGFNDFGLITAVYADNVTIDRCLFHDAPEYGFHALRDSQNFRVQFCRTMLGVANAHTAHFVEVARAAILNSIFEGLKSTNSNTLLSLGCNADVLLPGENMLIVGNTFSGAGLQLDMAGIRHSVVANNLFIDQTGGSAVCLQMEAWNHVTTKYDCLENLVANNVFYNARQGIFLLGLDATYGCKRNLLANNLIIDGPDQNMVMGIQEAGTAAGNVANRFLNNSIIGVSSTPFALNSPTSVARGNLGYNPVGVLGPPAVPASTVAYTNAYNVDAMVYVAGGTVTVIAVGGVTTGMTSGAFRVPAGGTITITYSVVPTWVWVGE